MLWRKGTHIQSNLSAIIELFARFRKPEGNVDGRRGVRYCIALSTKLGFVTRPRRWPIGCLANATHQRIHSRKRNAVCSTSIYRCEVYSANYLQKLTIRWVLTNQDIIQASIQVKSGRQGRLSEPPGWRSDRHACSSSGAVATGRIPPPIRGEWLFCASSITCGWYTRILCIYTQ